MILYEVVTKVLDKEIFAQHNIADLISGITFVWFSQKPSLWKEINTHTHTPTHAHPHTPTPTPTHTHTHTQVSRGVNTSPAQVNTSLIRIYMSPTQVRHESKQINASATRISRSLKGVNTSNLCSLLHLTSIHLLELRLKENQKQVPGISKRTRSFHE